MRQTIFRLLATLILLATATNAVAQKTDPRTGINWPVIVGAGTPVATGQVCGVNNYGQPYQNGAVTPNTRYHCSSNGWELDSTGGVDPTAVHYNPGTTLYLWVGPASIISDDTSIISPTYTVTSYTVVGTTVTVNTSTNHNLSNGDSVFTGNMTGWPAVPGGDPYTGGDIFTVHITSPTQFTFTYTGGGASTCASSCGSVLDQRFWMPYYTSNLPFFKGHGTTAFQMPIGATLSSLQSNYSTTIHQWLVANAGNTSYVFITGAQNDFQFCATPATMKSEYSSIFSSIHADGGTVIVATNVPGPWNTSNLGCPTAMTNMSDVNEWLRGQTKTYANYASGAYADRIVDAYAVLPDLRDPYLYSVGGTGGMSTAGIARFAHLINEGMSTQDTAIRQYPSWVIPSPWGGTIASDLSGVAFRPAFEDSTWAFAIWNHAGTNTLERWDTANGFIYMYGAGATGCLQLDGNSKLGATGGNCVNALPGTNGILKNTSTSASATATAQDMNLPYVCADTSGSGTAQSCSTVPTFTPAFGNKISYTTTTTNTGDVTLNVNSSSAIHIRKWSGAQVLVAGDLVANTPVSLTYDGTYWEIPTIGNAPTTAACGSGNIPCTNMANTFSTGTQTVVTGAPNTIGQVIKATTGPVPVALIHSCSNTGNSCSLGTVTAGNNIVVFCSTGGFSHITIVAADSLVNSYTLIASYGGAFPQGVISVNESFLTTGGSDTVNCAGNQDILAVEFSGLAHSSFKETDSNVNSPSSPQSLSVTTASSDYILTAFYGINGSTWTSSTLTGAGYTSVGTLANIYNVYGQSLGAGSPSVSWTNVGGSGTAYGATMIALHTFGTSPQTSDLQQFQDASAGVMSKVDANGVFVGPATNGTVTYTSSQSASLADGSKLVIMNCATACAYTLPATQPSTTWQVRVTSQGAADATIVLGGADTYNGGTAVPILTKNLILQVNANSAVTTDYAGNIPAASAPAFGTGNPFGINTPTVVNAVTVNNTFTATSGNQIIVWWTSWDNSDSTTPTISDTLGTAFGPPVATYNNGDGHGYRKVWMGTLTSSGTNAVSITGGVSHQMWNVIEATSVSSVTDGWTHGTALTEALTTTVAKDLLLSLYQEGGNTCPSAISGGWTFTCGRDNGWNTAAFGVQIATTATSYSVTWTTGNTPNYVDVLAFEASATPVAGTEGQLYYDTSTGPYTKYVYHTGAWHLL